MPYKSRKGEIVAWVSDGSPIPSLMRIFFPSAPAAIDIPTAEKTDVKFKKIVLTRPTPTSATIGKISPRGNIERKNLPLNSVSYLFSPSVIFVSYGFSFKGFVFSLYYLFSFIAINRY